ncbi:MAG: hypothetical protein BWY26_01115 [Elusimicrobia bacterium ADurb.Bin231]|nr:MAG: hypothetical protein BWY26_01115 [Elusimicrobia bacterium ADurb.Bin231]
MKFENEYIDERDLSRLIKRALSSIRNDRFKGQGVPFIKVGRSVRYSYSDAIAFMEQRKIKTDPI